MSRHISILFLALLSVLCAPAQPWAAVWMSHPEADGTSEVWFRRAFVSAGRPLRAAVSVVTTGRCVLYVNGRNVSTALFVPARADGDTAAVSVTYDVTRFMRRDTNTVCVLYCPSVCTRRQVAVDFWGVSASGARFAHSGAAGWLCRRGATHVEDGVPFCDGTVADVSWSHADMAVPAWLPVWGGAAGGGVLRDLGMSGESMAGHGVRFYDVLPDSVPRTRSVLVPRYFDTDGHSVTYDFSPGFYGMVRVTLRGCRRGERISVGNVHYTCSGDMDEQVYCRFAPVYMRRVTVSGDARFSPMQVQSVEAVNAVVSPFPFL